jgi:chorismate mutase
MPIRAVRGATTAAENLREAILEATDELLQELIQANDLRTHEVIAATFSVTPDLDQAYPAEAARMLGWTDAALMCVQEMHVERGLEKCIRVRVLWETDKPQGEIRHRYIRRAADLRRDR